jgi:hypothetical protein
MTRLGLAQYEAHATAARTEAERAAKAKALQVILLVHVLCITTTVMPCMSHVFEPAQQRTERISSQ